MSPPSCSAFPDMPTDPGWYWVRTRTISDAPWMVLEVHHNEHGVPEWRDDGESWPIEPNADFVGPLIPPNAQEMRAGSESGSSNEKS